MLSLPLLLYVAFAAIVYLVARRRARAQHRSHRLLQAGRRDSRANHPDGAYWRASTRCTSYSVLVAYSTTTPASHIASLKLLLAGMTVAYLVSLRASARSSSPARDRLQCSFSLLSALFVSFGASFWGMTDFAASLHRTLIVPVLRPDPLVLPALPRLALALRHLPAAGARSRCSISARYYLLLVLVAFEGLDFLFLRKCRLDRRLLLLRARDRSRDHHARSWSTTERARVHRASWTTLRAGLVGDGRRADAPRKPGRSSSTRFRGATCRCR